MHGWVVASLFTLPAPAGTMRMNHSVPEQLCIKSNVFRKSFGSPYKNIKRAKCASSGFLLCVYFIVVFHKSFGSPCENVNKQASQQTNK